ncbi:hypothetical protein [Lentzea sp. NPDC059081]|uniref:hypothetical protein n=1 Tax=Lentzea sp. NPDC059081 TaxID=3346719 RepID=UPI0036AA5E3F
MGTLRDDVDLTEFAALRGAERQQLEALQSAGKVGAHYVSPARRTTFVEVIATDEEQVLATLGTLPFARFFDADVYPTAPEN